MRPREVKIRPIEEGQVFDLRGARFLMKASSAETDGKFCVYQVVVPPRAGVPLHRHPYAEVFYVLVGRPDFCPDAERSQAMDHNWCRRDRGGPLRRAAWRAQH